MITCRRGTSALCDSFPYLIVGKNTRVITVKLRFPVEFFVPLVFLYCSILLTMKVSLISFLIALIVAIAAAAEEGPVVDTTTGKLKGQLVKLPGADADVYEFSSIP